MKFFGIMTNEVAGTIPIKSTQGAEGSSGLVQKYGCIVMEVQDYIDAINHPEWMREKKQIFGPASPAYTLEAQYVFSTTE
jgi:aldose 1-epimerase